MTVKRRCSAFPKRSVKFSCCDFNMSINSFTVLGSSSGFPQAGRSSSGYLLKVGDSLSLIDCGGGVTSSFLRTGADPLKVDRIFISHTHSDHVCELSLFIQLIDLNGRTDRLDVYLPSEFVEIFRQYLYAVYLFPKRMPFELKLIGYEAGFEFDNDFILKAYSTSHLKKYAENIGGLDIPNKMQCHCFQIELAGKRLFYSADLGKFEDVTKYLNNNDYAIIETTHIDIEEFLSVSGKYNVGRYILTHLGSPEEVEQIRQAISKSGLSNVSIAEDGLVLPL